MRELQVSQRREIHKPLDSASGYEHGQYVSTFFCFWRTTAVMFIVFEHIAFG
jgi:hypothetical protein